MAILGAHMSMAGGLWKAVERATAVNCRCLQIFTKNNNQWKAKPLDPTIAERFVAAVEEAGLEGTVAHNSYLINLASPDDELWKKSIDAMVIEVQRAEMLQLPGVVMHPGAFTTSSAEAGLQRIAQALDEVHRQVPEAKTECLLETTAGQGSHLGWRFEHLAEILANVQEPDRLGCCFDTCHVFAAGYPLTKPSEYKATMEEFDSLVGVQRIKAFHLNDSKAEFGKRVDRHDHIGKGKMGIEPFRNLLRDRRFAKVPMYLETPKGEQDGQDLDAINLSILRGLLKK